ncbi:TNFAIP3-interacting protein 3 isoform X3 [Marmota marmota marmota]|uniref:TNFAIP3-interacting protein 3 isoform X3 n=1 Tax=Marmota marmota marmota TaxID=9994 RepID=UPI0020924D10|nr:TNFAIP3-interacting protein 3 isoform X3 [Marmota marmota marmota]
MKQEGLQACWRDNQTPCGRPVSRDENQDKKLVMLTHQPEDSERCESMELDNKIRDLIERNASLDPKGVPPEATLSHRKACPPKTPRKTASVAHSAQGTAGMSTVDSSADQAELLQVNQQWDEQFRSMKELYERKVAELRTRLRAAEGALGELECERRSQSAGGAARGPRLEEERETLNEELQELKKENKLLKEKNALAMKKKEHYECEIQRLNKALQDVLKIEGASSPGDRRGMCPVECSHAATRTEVEVLKQQVQIYEEDFRKERSDRERLSREKEELRRAHQASRAQLTRLSSQIKVCQMEKEKLEKQLKQIHFPACTCGLAFHLRDPGVPAGPRTTQDQWEHPPGPPRCALDLLPPDGQHNDNGLSSEKKPPK